MPANITIRSATAADASSLTKLTRRSKAHWGYSQAFMAACDDELVVSAEAIADSAVDYFICMVDGEIVGYCAVAIIAADESQLDALFVDPLFIGQGYGRRLMEYTKKLLIRQRVKSLLIHSDPYAEKFYLAAGGVRIGERESGSIAGRLLPLIRIKLT